MDFKLTSSQLNFYTRHHNVSDSIWNQGLIQSFPKVYDYQFLNDAFNDLVRNQESLLVRFKESADGVCMRLEDFEYVNYPLLNLSSEEDFETELQNFLNDTIDLDSALFRCIIFQTPTSSGYLINTHHIVVDGFSGLVMAEHTNNYLKNPDYIPQTPLTYYEYIEKENKYKSSKRFQRSKDFWAEQFSNDPLCKIIPKESALFEYDSAIEEYNFPEEFFEQISEFCNLNDISVPSFFNFVFATYFHKIYDINNFTLGIPVLNRTTQSEFNTIGLYMHILPMIINLSDESIIENIKEIENSHINLFRHQSFTQHDIKEVLKEPKASLFDIAIDYEELPKSKDYDVDICYSKDLSLSMEIHIFNMADKKKLKVRYRTALFCEAEINSMINSVIALAENVLKNADKKIGNLEIISEKDKNTLLNKFNNTAVTYNKDYCINLLFEDCVRNSPEKTAVIFKDMQLSYSELNELVNDYAGKLSYLGVKENDVVAILLERSHQLIALQLAVLKIGAIFMPLDKRYPEERIKYACTDCNVKVLITDESFAIPDTTVDITTFEDITAEAINQTVINKGPCYII